jgi:hypothetical protein
MQRLEFLAWFDTEQEYIDAMFALVIMANFGVWLDPEDMLNDCAGKSRFPDR